MNHQGRYEKPAFIPKDEDGHSSYFPFDEAISDRQLRVAILREALVDIAAWRDRYAAFFQCTGETEALAIVLEIDKAREAMGTRWPAANNGPVNCADNHP